MKNAHHDPDLGYTHAHVEDDGGIMLHRDSEMSGHSTFDLGICATKIAIDILRLSGQADATVVQSIANTIEARADCGDTLSVAEMRGIAATLRFGVGVPVAPVLATRPSNVVAFPARTVAVRMQGVVG